MYVRAGERVEVGQTLLGLDVTEFRIHHRAARAAWLGAKVRAEALDERKPACRAWAVLLLEERAPRGKRPDNPFPGFRADKAGRGVRRDRPAAASSRAGMQARTTTVRIGGQIGRPGIGPPIIQLPPDALDGVTGWESERCCPGLAPRARGCHAGTRVLGSVSLVPGSASMVVKGVWQDRPEFDGEGVVMIRSPGGRR